MKKKMPTTEKPKRKMGRPSLGRDARNIPFALRISENELEAWGRLAAEKGMTVREYLLHPHRQALKRRKKA